MEEVVVVAEPPPKITTVVEYEEEIEEDDDGDDLSLSSDSDIAEALDWLDGKDDDELIGGGFSLHARRPNAHGGHGSRPNSSALQPISNKAQKLTSHVRASPLEGWEGRVKVGMSNSVTTAIRGSLRETEIGRSRNTDKADRATVEQALDPRTRMVLFRMLNRGVFNDVNGCISTGKEANVYHATKSDGSELAIKVYKTSVLEITVLDMATVVTIPRKMVKTWAEKEQRNLKRYWLYTCFIGRLHAAGIRCPAVILLRLHVLVMEFIGRDGWAAPRLKDAALSLDKLRECYLELIIQMRVLYQKCKLVHGDLSEYNILYFEGHLYIIDVSQSVDLDHPLALNFLREDCDHVSDFFKKHGVAVMTIPELFDFIVDPTISDENVDSYLEEVQLKVIERGEISVEDEIADSVFMKSYIPKSLDAVNNPEADVAKITSGQDTGDMLYQTITGLKDALPKVDEQQIEVNAEEEEEEEEDGSGEESEEENEGELGPEDKKAARKEHKKKVKEEKRESRKTKTPKSVKKRKKKVSKPHKTR
ncbi:hypothetical protein ARALYDRAFT_493708 [Arabidopsis lyrata subsp. lyrata]|uniref:Serine/threonine-protein kinase RIO1 n=1 Tax=Arabidopsis lyrata subsp. lyrata TaxID=81972 RepID=D7MI96_ARALL|nr:hypothetical protein ARALYDRAFT_493708 [Arabidopsis lyrata subsp. lyrata]